MLFKTISKIHKARKSIKKLCLLLCFIGTHIYAQSDVLARQYFKNSDFKKALHEYKKLHSKSPTNINYITQVMSTYQQLEAYNEAEYFLKTIMQGFSYPSFLVELGYNYKLKNDTINANLNFNKAIESIETKPTNVYAITRSFESHSLLNEAIVSYEKAMLISKTNFNIQLARLYGEQGHIEKMFTSYIDCLEANPATLSNIKYSINDFISENSENKNNILFKKTLLKKAQQEPNVLWNGLLSWLFIQQKNYNKAFIQEKAIFNRKPESLTRIKDLAKIASEDTGNHEISKEIYTFIIEKAQDKISLLKAHYNLLQLETKESSKNDYKNIHAKYLELFEEHGLFSQTLNLQISYAHFLAFYMNQTSEATAFLEKTLKLSLSRTDKAKAKLELGDILVLQEKFNEALIYYTQIQRNLKNSVISQEARYKVAKTSYYKGDFKWAESQLKILKASTSQLTANDALDLKLLITDNKYDDSLQTALKLYAKADLLAFQNRNDEAIIMLDKVLEAHKTEPIIAQALYKQAQLFVQNKAFEKAEANYNAIITNYGDGILVDDAYFKLAEIYTTRLNLPEKAKGLYEKIIFNHADSIYFVDARKKYRALRGDAIN